MTHVGTALLPHTLLSPVLYSNYTNKVLLKCYRIGQNNFKILLDDPPLTLKMIYA